MIKSIGYANIGFEKEVIISFLKNLNGIIIDCRLKPYGLVSMPELRQLPNYL